MKKTLLFILLLSFGFSQRQEKNEIITERHDNGVKKLVLVFEGTGINETLIGRYGFYDTGVKHFVELYKNNQKHEKSIYWYKNGQKSVERTYKDGIPDGLTTTWYENGQKYVEGTYKDGSKYGEWIYYTKDGQIRRENTDTDGNPYKTVRIGKQIWMAENLKVIYFQNGDLIPNITNNDNWKNTKQGAYCNFNNDTNNVETYGRLYNWFAVDDKRGLAPKGWHIPTDEEWDELVDYLGGDKKAGDKLKSRGTIEYETGLWEERNKGATNESGFTGLPGGERIGNTGVYTSMGLNGVFWSSTDKTSIPMRAFYRTLSYMKSEVLRYPSIKKYGCSVRCIRD